MILSDGVYALGCGFVVFIMPMFVCMMSVLFGALLFAVFCMSIMVPCSMLHSPRNVATNMFLGLLYRFFGVPICSIRPSLMMAMVSDIANASSWSWVT